MIQTILVLGRGTGKLCLVNDAHLILFWLKRMAFRTKVYAFLEEEEKKEEEEEKQVKKKKKRKFILVILFLNN